MDHHGHSDELSSLPRFPSHGSFEGHVLPGSFFVIWGAWWYISILLRYLHCKDFGTLYQSRAWYPQMFLRKIPLEPYIKIGFTTIGIIAEIFSGGARYVHLYDQNGQFVTHSLNVWQHAAMYGAFLLSGCVDLLGCRYQLPDGTEMGFLGLAFFSEAVLMLFHLKGSPLEMRVHLLLGLAMMATAAVTFAEIRHRKSPLLAAARACGVLLQGTWFIQVAYILFTDMPQWDPRYMGSAMFVPVVFISHYLAIVTSFLVVFLVVAACRLHERIPPLEEPGTVPPSPLPLSRHARLHPAGDSEQQQLLEWRQHKGTSRLLD